MSNKSHREFAGDTLPAINRRLARRRWMRRAKAEPMVNAHKLGYAVDEKRPYTFASALHGSKFVDVGERFVRVALKLKTRSKYLPA